MPMQVGDLVVPCDFMVMDMEEDPYTPLILGRAVLKTLQAVINCHNYTITVEVAQRKVVFKISQIMRKPMVEQVNQINSIDRDFEEFQREVGIGYSREEEFSLFEEGICEEYVREEDDESETEGYASEETEFEQIFMDTKGNDDEDKSSMPPRKVSLKPLPPSLKYAYLDANGNKPVIVSFELDDTSLEKLLALLNKYQSVIGYSLDDIKGISPKLVMRRIPLDDEHFSSIEPQHERVSYGGNA